MTVPTSRTLAQVASVITTLPAEVARRLGIGPGQELDWIGDGRFPRGAAYSRNRRGAGGPATNMAEYDSVFRALARDRLKPAS